MGIKKPRTGVLIETYKDEPGYGTWRGYRVIAADGSSLRLPDSKESDFEHLIETRDGNTRVRVIALTLNSGETEILITSLFDNIAFTSQDMIKIYFLRWHIEECYKRLKVCMEIENSSGIHLEAVLQEFWAHLFMCNVLSLQFCDTQGPWNPDNPGTYRLNFSVLFGVMRQQLQQVVLGNCEPDLFQKLFIRAASRAKVKIRPNRIFSRDKVGKPKRHQTFRRVC